MTNRSNRPKSMSLRGTSQSRRSRERLSARSGPSRRHRRLFVEPLAERSLLAAIAKFDFDTVSGQPGPVGWTHIYPGANGPNGDQPVVDPSGPGIVLTGIAPNGFLADYAASSTVPSDAVGIKNF